MPNYDHPIPPPISPVTVDLGGEMSTHIPIRFLQTLWDYLALFGQNT